MVVGAQVIDIHNLRMVQIGDYSALIEKSSGKTRLRHKGGRQYFKGDLPAEGFLNGHKNTGHGALAYFLMDDKSRDFH
jgi:hypothetical protein